MKSIDEMDFFAYMDIYIYQIKQLLKQVNKKDKKLDKKMFIDELGFF